MSDPTSDPAPDPSPAAAAPDLAEPIESDDPLATPTPDEATLAVVLAAGAGSRFVGETHKLATRLQRKPLLWWAARHALDAGFGEVLVIEGAVPVADLVPAEVSIVRNDDWQDGQARSLHVAVHYAGLFDYDAVVVGLGDQPFAPPEAWRRVAASDSPIAVARFDDDRETPPVRLDRDVWRLLPIDGDEGARQLLRSRPELVTPVPCPGSAVDVDTPAELERVRRLPQTKELGQWT